MLQLGLDVVLGQRHLAGGCGLAHQAQLYLGAGVGGLYGLAVVFGHLGDGNVSLHLGVKLFDVGISGFGALLVDFILFFPMGLVGFFERLAVCNDGCAAQADALFLRLAGVGVDGIACGGSFGRCGFDGGYVKSPL